MSCNGVGYGSPSRKSAANIKALISQQKRHNNAPSDVDVDSPFRGIGCLRPVRERRSI
jgi:hypothetical protein